MSKIVTPVTKHISEVFSKLAKNKKKGSNFMDICFSLTNRGVGHKITKIGWQEPNTYWTVTKVKFGENIGTNTSLRGKAWGYLTWGGKTDQKIRKVIDIYEKKWSAFPYIKPVIIADEKLVESNTEQPKEQEQQNTQ
ncbi:hypothetical protein DLAC_06758 [Tieghemostelium lacteum]|uniref:Uncharacterized protein n=1 Tax=Tieghemostelium lacteum TaxID=361077 RepID=A0A151ZFW2_TIELA|nr:hypothetical protein DLAC_06758 [Tieghemostelium lacteum]|eukprot:KYQ92754.1 hypothetical protein DLAC_06758 [Tieghemostelium lacteum]